MTHDFTIPSLGPCRFDSPIRLSRRADDLVANYVSDDQRIVYTLDLTPGKEYRFEARELLELAGPRERIFFEPSTVHAAIVTCGGLCPGLNDVIRAVVMCLWHDYGVRRISGVRFGYRGMIEDYGLEPMELTPDTVNHIQHLGGTILGSSRGEGGRTGDIVDWLARRNVNVLFTVGGDGTQKGALKIAQEARRRGLTLAVVGVPKTIDNDLSFIERSFGFETAVGRAVEAVTGAHVEAQGAPGGIGLVKVMGRESGFIAAHTALATCDVNFVLVPEVPFELEGPNGLLVHLERRLKARNHAVILVAEGAGQELCTAATGTDASGNRRLGDIGAFLAERITRHFAEIGMEVSLKYIDPSYIIRSAPADADDSVYCARLGANAVHAALAGKTCMVIGMVNNRLVHVPIAEAVEQRRRVDPESALWRDVVMTTGQPALMVNRGGMA